MAHLVALTLLALLVRAAAESVGGPASDGDWPVYARVAANILRGCGVSLSDPTGKACVPQFGGNGLPGYPAFIAATWALFGVGKQQVLWAQAGIACLAVPYLAYAVGRMSGPAMGLLAGMVAALSPLQAFMVKFGLAEALTIAAINWLLAEFALSVALQRLRVVPIACAVSVALWLRLDSVLLLLPVAVLGLYLHRFGAAVSRGAAIALIIAAPLAAWSVRNVAVGLPLKPPASGWLLPDGSQGPLGYFAWVGQWATTPSERSNALFFETTNFNRIKLAPAYARSPDDRAIIESLMDRLRAASGAPFPVEIDAEFKRLAGERMAERPALQTLRLRLLQAVSLWRAWATPLPIDYAPAASESTAAFARDWIANSTHTLGGLLTTAIWLYRFLLAGVFIVTAAASILFWQRPVCAFALGALAMIAGKAALAVLILAMEIRYTVTVVPLIELTALLGLHYAATAGNMRSAALNRPARA